MSPLYRITRHNTRGHLTCPICNEPVSLENSKTDEDGHATHEECYVAKVCKKDASETNRNNNLETKRNGMSN